MCVKVIASQRWDVFLRHGVYVSGLSPKKLWIDVMKLFSDLRFYTGTS